MFKKHIFGTCIALLVLLGTLTSPALADNGRWRHDHRPHHHSHHYSHTYTYRPVVRYYAPPVRYYAPVPYYARPYQPGVTFSLPLPLPFFGLYIR